MNTFSSVLICYVKLIYIYNNNTINKGVSNACVHKNQSMAERKTYGVENQFVSYLTYDYLNMTPNLQYNIA